MELADKRHVWKDSLLAMKNSLMTTYEMITSIEEERSLIRALTGNGYDYIKFSGYRRNEGFRRYTDVAEIIDNAIMEIEASTLQQASMIYLRTLRSVALLSKWAKVLEESSNGFDFLQADFSTYQR
ncbi:MAG: hypothetical protein BAJATHORv1_10164 [Candidatus Thorarchaeota archaeon]|nr:MAG: hypothetical protein BAJATHORv1_10164 [Candidatus Thorarchaeota archaeon]